MRLLWIGAIALLLWVAASAFHNRSTEPTPEAGISSDSPAPSSRISGSSSDSPDPPPANARALHEQHQQSQAPVPLTVRREIDPNRPLPLDGLGRVQLDWDVLGATRLKGATPSFPASLNAVDGKSATLVGYMCPLDEVGEINAFLLLETPVGCFYCQPASPTGIVYVELGKGRREPLRFEPVRVTGSLRLNHDNPEDFLFGLDDASVAPAD